MNKVKAIILISVSLALVGAGFWFYEKQRVQKLNEQVDSVDDALSKLNQAIQ